MHNGDQRAISHARDVLVAGGLVAFPTDTFYALGGNALDRGVLARIFAVKRRRESEPLPIFVNSISQLLSVAKAVNEVTQSLARLFWPGKLTLLVERASSVPAELTAGQSSVGVRIPQHSSALALLKKVNFPIVATSANLSGHKPCQTADEVEAQLTEKVDFVLAGRCGDANQPSTIIDSRKAPIRIVRQGALRAESIGSALDYV